MKNIAFSTLYDANLISKILELLKKSDSYTMLEFSEALGKEYAQATPGWEDLRLHLIYMTKKGMIEERHFGKDAGDWNRIVDYA